MVDEKCTANMYLPCSERRRIFVVALFLHNITTRLKKAIELNCNRPGRQMPPYKVQRSGRSHGPEVLMVRRLLRSRPTRPLDLYRLKLNI